MNPNSLPLRQHPKLAVILWSILLLILGGSCTTDVESGERRPSSPSVSPAPFDLSLTEIPVEQALEYFQDPVSQEKLSGIESITQSGWKYVHVISKFGPLGGSLTSGVYVVLKPGQTLSGYILLISTLNYPHNFMLLPTLDYRPIQITPDGSLRPFPRLRLEPGVWRAFRFSLTSPLPEGLHTLIITLIIEPDHFFALNPNPALFDPAENEAMGFRNDTIEFGLLTWVTSRFPQTVLDWPPQARSIPPDQTVLLTEAVLLKEKPAPGAPELFLNKDTARAGETITYYAKFGMGGKGVAKEEIPVRVLIFWDETLTQVDDLSVPTQWAAERKPIPLRISVPTNLTEGEHTLTVVAYPYPYYLRWWKDGREWHPNAGAFSLPMARLPVTIESPP
ncbi:MAG TPA: hypothetical protein ENK56_09950 [Chloroflexi bacterium]|nr:hypothetical protein [Chloroflexota bacterium]